MCQISWTYYLNLTINNECSWQNFQVRVTTEKAAASWTKPQRAEAAGVAAERKMAEDKAAARVAAADG